MAKTKSNPAKPAKPAKTPQPGTVPAKKAATGTTYQAQGINDPLLVQPQLDSELGSSQPSVIRETVPELISPYQRLLTYTKMMNDAGVDVSMRAAKTPILGADFYVDPYDSLPINKEIAEFVWDNLDGGMSSPFCSSLEDILHFFEDGYTVMEKVVELREWTPKGQNRNTRVYTMLKKLAVRPTSTIKEIVYDNNGGPTNVTQTAIRPGGVTEDVDMDISKVMIFTFERKGGDLTGRSLLRTAYKHWYYKEHFYKLDAIQKERHSLGVPKGKLMPGYKKEDKEILRNLLRNLRNNEEAFLLLPPNVDVEFAEVHGHLVNVLDSANQHNMMILLNVLAAFLGLGLEGTTGGGRAVGSTQSDIYMKSLRYVANYVCDVVNMYVIPELVVWNYPTKNFPQLKVRNIGETRDLQMLGAAIANLVAQGALVMDDPTEAWVRHVFDMPQKDPTTERAIPGSVLPLDTGASPNSNGASGANGASKPQKGDVKPTTGTGNVGKPPSGQ
jgi:hypothetical protein